MDYEHTQVAGPFQVMLAVFALVMLALAVFLWPRPACAAMVGAALAMMAVSVFTRLTTRVGSGHLEYHFGAGVWRTRVPLDQMASAAPVRNAWWYGFGIRLTPHGWLYNVWGLDAVEVRLRDGRAFRLGTDDPDALARAIRDAAGV
jgi:hypothetical protein